MTWLIASLGVLIGLATGLVGAGGSILTVLLLIHAGGLDVGPAITTSLVVVAGMSLVALVPYARTGAVSFRAAAAFGASSMVGAYLGGHISRWIPERVLLFLFLLTMVVAAVAMLWERPPPADDRAPSRRQYLVVLGTGGLAVGALTGLVGLGGGFAVVPLLVLFDRMPVRRAVGTSILLIAMNTLAGLAGHLPHLAVDWQTAAYLGVAEAAGGLAGVRLARHVGTTALRRAFAALMIVAAVLQLGSTLRR
jgi:uncharacterized membrane protein YfcA